MRPHTPYLLAAWVTVFALTACDDTVVEAEPDALVMRIDQGFVAPPIVDARPPLDTSPGPDAGPAGDGGLPDGGRPERQPYCDPMARERCNDIDDDCDAIVDEGCTCTVPEKPCYSGHPADLEGERTACRAGIQSCRLEFYGPCEGQVGPTDEACNGIDDDCDGFADEVADCQNRPPVAVCPPDLRGPPLSDFTLAGGYEDPEGHPMVRALWRFLEQPGGSTARLRPTEGLEATFFADLQGDYLLELTVVDSEGGIGRCTTRVSARTRDALRIEMVWNANASDDTSDLDLHLKRAPDARWFDGGPAGDDCYFLNCKVCGQATEDECRAEIAAINADPNRDPPPQVQWTAPLDADDPRLDLDDVEGQGPENINILRPRAGTYRLGVHYYDDDGYGPATVTVRIYCDGDLTSAFEPVVLQATGEDNGPRNEFWEVADIVWSGGTCRVEPLEETCLRICTTDEAESNGFCRPGRSRGQRCP